MNRRTALMLSMFLGGLIPRGLWAQTAGRKSSKSRDKALQPVSRSDDPDDAAVPPANDEPPRSVRPRAGLSVAQVPDHALHQGRQRPGQSRKRPSSIGSSNAPACPTGTARKSLCSPPARPSSVLTTRPKSSNKSTRSSNGSPTRPRTFCRFTSSSSPQSTPAGATRSIRGSRSSAAARRANRSGPCGWKTPPWYSRKCRCSRGSASWPTSGSK